MPEDRSPLDSPSCPPGRVDAVAAARAEARALVGALEQLTRSRDPGGVLRDLLDEARPVLSARHVFCVVRRADGDDRIEATDDTALDGRSLDGAARLLDRPRHVFDLAADTRWASLRASLPVPARSLLSAPLALPGGARAAVVALHADPDRFDADRRRALSRFAWLAEQALGTRELRWRNTLLAHVIDGASSGVAIADARKPARPLIYVNRAFEDITGWRAEEVLGRNCRFLSDEPPGGQTRRRLRDCVAQNGSDSFILRNRRKDGTAFWNALTLYPVRDETGAPRYLVGTQTDATESVTARLQTEHARQRLDDALSHTRDAVLLLGEDETVRYANPMVRRLFPAGPAGWRGGSALRENWAACLSGLTAEDAARLAPFRCPNLSALIDRADGVEMQLRGRFVLLRGQRTADGGAVLSATDITALKSAESALRQRVAAIDLAPDGIAVVDAQHRLVQANPSLAALCEAPNAEAMLGRDWWTPYAADNPPGARGAIEAGLVRDGKGEGRLDRTASDGTRAVHAVSLAQAGTAARILIVQDVTAQAEAQRRRQELAERLEEARRQQTLSQMTAGLAHDFNNLLSAINGSATLIGSDNAAEPALRRHADRILAAGTQAAHLMHRFMALGRAPLRPERFDLAQVATEAVELFSAILTDATRLRTTFPDGPVQAFGNPTEAGQIVLNLLINAQDALEQAPGTVTVTLHAAVEPDGAAYKAVVQGRLRPGRRYVRLVVSDTGSGIPADHLPRIFDAWFSTKAERGTGLGLSSVAALMREAGGAVALRTAPGTGTRFDVFWPCDDPSGQPPDPIASLSEGIRLDGRVILVVDDEPALADMLCTCLERLGAEVAAVSDPALAIEALREDPGAWSALVTDFDMPGLTGKDVAQAARQSDPAMPVFLVTALGTRRAEGGLDRLVDAVFDKPVDLGRLARLLADSTRPATGSAR